MEKGVGVVRDYGVGRCGEVRLALGCDMGGPGVGSKGEMLLALGCDTGRCGWL